MRKQLLGLLAVLVLPIFFACHQQNRLDRKVDEIADLECRAIALREQRFALANQLRFAQDTLMITKSALDSERLSAQIGVFTKEKENLLQHSLQLADTIHLQMDSLRKFVFTQPSDKEKFNQQLKTILQKRGCDK